MVCKLYGKPGEFLEENRDFLLENEALVQLNLGNAQTHREEGCHPGLLFGRYEEEGRMCLLFGNTAPWNICLNAPQGMEKSMEAAGELARYLREGNIEIAGVTAREDLAKAFMEAYGGGFSLRSSMDIMVLKKVIQPENHRGRYGPCGAVVPWLLSGHPRGRPQPGGHPQRTGRTGGKRPLLSF